MFKNYLRVLQEMYVQSQQIGLLMREKHVQNRLQDIRNYYIESETIMNPSSDFD